jgi:uncharacterized protein YndB with AHSA1/START domain
VSLSYDAPSDGTGKTTAHTDTYHGRFVTLVPDERIVEIDVFETDDPLLRGAMTVTITLSDEAGGTRRGRARRRAARRAGRRQRDRLADGAREARGARRARLSRPAAHTLPAGSAKARRMRHWPPLRAARRPPARCVPAFRLRTRDRR